LTLRANAIASHIILDNHTGKACGVGFVDRVTKKSYEVFAKIVVLAASTIASTRLMLNSSSRQYPVGLGNSSGTLGCYLGGHIHSVWLTGVAPQVSNCSSKLDYGRPNQIYIPRFRNLGKKHPEFIRGYGIEGAVQRKMLPATVDRLPGFGPEFKRLVRENQDAVPFWMSCFGEMLPRADNRVTIDNNTKDAFGIPVPKIECSYGDNEIKMGRDMVDSMREMAEAAGFHVETERTALGTPGLCSHEVGTARMGNDPRTSVLNRFNQSWDVKNLFVVDGSCYVSSGVQNPTLTMMALTARACSYIIDQYRCGNL